MLSRSLSRSNLTLAPKRLLARPSLAPLPPRAPLSRLSPCTKSTYPLLLSRSYAQGPPGGGGMGGFPGFSMMGQQRQKGDALKEYVSPFARILFLLPSFRLLVSATYPTYEPRVLLCHAPGYPHNDRQV